MEAEQLQKLIASGISYIAIHPRSKGEIEVYLKKRIQKLRMHKNTLYEALQRLQELSFVDDEAYARFFVESRIRSRPKGEHLIRQELKRKGIQEDVIDVVCKEYFLHQKQGQNTEADLAKRLLQKRWKVWRNLSVRERKQRAYRYLASRGFSSSTVYSVIDEQSKIDYNTN